MKIAAISREGLAAIALLVAVLWGCVGLERLSILESNHTYQSLLPIRAQRPSKALSAERCTTAACVVQREGRSARPGRTISMRLMVELSNRVQTALRYRAGPRGAAETLAHGSRSTSLLE